MIKKPHLEQKILNAARKHFFQKGYRNTSMEEIALDLGMSKKTIYLYFSGKENLLSAVIQAFQMKLSAKIETVLENRHLSYLVKLSTVLTLFAQNLASPNLYDDLKVRAPEIWHSLRNFINESSLQLLFKLLQQGVDLGYINPRISPGVIVMMYASALQSFMDPEINQQFFQNEAKYSVPSLSNTIEQAVRLIYEGILSDKARAELSST
jgi:AcrR family transcriptional regulator